ncbi:4Fe-4S dicluster domain-containing protein [Virgibacillus sp. NKC19-3]|uniref:4Fe-4S dicluster domain-containing protein n=1 Tax=Virgibacillus saliphilus TaxID=2831674 RepID=UPI001C9A717D|nr:4Fe-4S dicluster domain-containing protein [Virgibacillus sp. NKC19-3]MBY7142069.1 4Fe-4S dicluster domain-containing protein [Virgibacillus sp. NKC19-3]
MAKTNDKAILVDISLCIGCKACQIACKEWHDLPATEFEKVSGTYQNPADRSENTPMLMRFLEKYDETTDTMDWLIWKDQCMHCTDAPCVEVCPSGALFTHEDGFVGLENDKCIGCTYCSKVCPFDSPRFETDALTGNKRMNKCDFCQDRVTNGELPACVQTCPTNALEFDTWDGAVEKAHERVEQIKDRYPEANVYGDKEMGGTHYIYVLTEKPETFGLPAQPETNDLVGFRQDVLKPATQLFMGATAVGLLTNFIISSSAFGNEETQEDQPKDGGEKDE